jgi:uncharacterized protein
MYTLTTHSPHARLRSLPVGAVTLAEGFWYERQMINRTVSIRQGYDKLEDAGNFNNFRLVLGQGHGQYQGPVFMDSDIYKWLEAAALDLSNLPDPDLERKIDETIALIAAAQMPDGYVNSHYQVLKPDRRWSNLAQDHEMYCAGHLIQAAVAHFRVTGKTSLLDVACKFADHINSVFGPGKRDGYCGHPEIETALIELYRVTDNKSYLELAEVLIDRRGQNRMDGYGHWGAAYHQDHLPVRQADEVVGHAVRQLYLNAGVTDLYMETGEAALLEAQRRQWKDMVSRKTFITGGQGARAFGEAFGEPYELPSLTCYCETCAAIASIMWNWRLLLATGEAFYADQLERALYNGFLSGVSLDGERYFYVNPLQSLGGVERHKWFGCACCPPNVMRQIASVQHFAASWDDQGIQLHQYFPGSIYAERPDGGRIMLEVHTRYPWEGRISVRVVAVTGDWQLSLRLPGWSRGCVLKVNGQASNLPIMSGAYARVSPACQAGDEIVLDLTIAPYYLQANPRIDALRGSLAIQRGPLVYCMEQNDQSRAVDLLDVAVNSYLPLQDTWRGDLLGGIVTIQTSGVIRTPETWQEELYLPTGAVQSTQRVTTLTAIPYYAWANRGAGAMRVWIPQI